MQSLLALGLFASGSSNKGYHLLLVEWPQLQGGIWCPNGYGLNGTGKLLGNFTVVLFRTNARVFLL